MVIKFDARKTKHQLFHLSISLGVILICMTHMQYSKNWTHLGSFWGSLIIPIIFTGEMLKIVLCCYYGRHDDLVLTPKQKQKKVVYFTPKDLAGGLLLQFLCTLLYAFICIILGAPVLQNYEQTFVLALLLTLLSVSPTVFLLGSGGALQVCFCENPDFLTKSEKTAVDLFKYNALGGILGAWAGSIVAPLDWDREWQTYPIPNIIGALLGSALSNIYACSCILYETGKAYMIFSFSSRIKQNPLVIITSKVEKRWGIFINAIAVGLFISFFLVALSLHCVTLDKMEKDKRKLHERHVTFKLVNVL